MIKQTLSRLWTDSVAYVALLTGAGLSIAGNVVDVQRVRGAAMDNLDVVMAVTFPALVVLMVEVFVNARWRGLPWYMQALRWLGCAGVTAVAMRVSWVHLNDLMLSRGQTQDVAILAPLAIDFLAIMATALILAGRGRVASPIGRAGQELNEISDAELDATLARWSIGQEIEQPAPISPAVPDKQWAIDVLPETQATSRQQRPTLDQQESALRRMLDGATPAQAEAETGVPLSTTRRYQTGINRARADVNAELKGIPAPLATIIRNHMTGLERAR